MKLHRIAVVCTALAMTCACGSTSKLTDFESAPTSNQLTEGENRLWSEVDNIIESIERSDAILRDDHVNQRLNEMLDRLYPEFADTLEIQVIKSPILNAFAFPNGRIFIHSGIIAAAQNEAQLAAVVAHEGAHFVKRHSAKQRIHHSNMTGFTVLLNLAGIPLVGEIIGASSMAGFSRDMEREADLEAIERMQAAGYDIAEAKAMFEFMASDSLANEHDGSWFFASHPDLMERISSFNKFVRRNEQQTSQKNLIGDFESDYKSVREYALEEKLELGMYTSLINEYENHLENSIYANNTNELAVYAEAYRLRNATGDSEISHRIYQQYLATSPQNGDAYMHAGVLSMNAQDFETARVYLSKALELGGSKVGYVKMYLKKLESKENQHAN